MTSAAGWMGAVVGLAVLSGCAPVLVRALPKIPDDEAITRPALRQMAALPDASIKVVLRVPAPQRAVAEEEKRTTGDLDQAYNIIEKELLKAGFTVRDRALLSEVLRTNPNLDYKTIRERIDTQFIIEIVSLAKHDFTTRDYMVAADRSLHEGHTPLKIEGWKLEAKIIVVETGEIGGMYTHYAPPQFLVRPEDRYFFYLLDNPDDPYVRTATALGQEQPEFSWYTVMPQDAATLFARKLIADMRGK